jgi:hypothetical protein
MKHSRQAGRVGLSGAALTLAALLGFAPQAPAQRLQTAADAQTEYFLIQDEDLSKPRVDWRQLRRQNGFQLFATGDYGAMGFRQAGRFSTKMDNYGPCSSAVRNCQGVQLRAARNNSTQALWFDMDWAYAAPPSEFRKIRRVAPSVANATGGGWSAGTGDMIQGRPRHLGPADGGLGRLASGALSTLDGACTDISGFGNGAHGGGVPLLAGSSCPDTWGNGVWAGDLPVDEAGWVNQFTALGAAFNWEFWRVPTELKRADKQFMGSGVSTYGETSDYYQQILPAYGSVLPGGAGSPAFQGYPLGLKIRFESFTFGVPSLAEIQYVQALVINRSQDVWGAPIDYDSLYMGLTAGFLLATQAGSAYPMPELGVTLWHNRRAVAVAPPGGVIPCTQAARTPNGVPVCPGAGGASNGYGNGAHALVFLKTPLGDLRNKLYTRTAGSILNGATTGAGPCTMGIDPFCMPTHPNAGDTITFNHHHSGGFGGPDQFTWGSGARARFGFMSSTEDNTIDGRDLSAQVAGTRFRVFYTATYPTEAGKYNKYAPGQGGQPGAFWDYNHDGQGDTLFFDACTITGCAKFSSDTIAAPPGFPGLHNTIGNVGGYIGFGPFALRAGDTTAFVFAQIGNGDSSLVWTSINSAVDLYNTSYLSPEAPPLPIVTATRVSPGSDAIGSLNPQVQLFFSEAPERWRDPFITKLAGDIQNAPLGTPFATLRVDNPTLVAQLTALATNNLEAIEIYKSCDAGTNWTDDGDCLGDPTRDDRSRSVGVGWAPYAVLDVNANQGNPPNTFTDANVDAGRTYMYTIVAKSRGAAFLISRGGVPDTLRLVPSIRNPLSRSTSDANVASLYIPISRQAGSQPSTAGLTEVDARVTIPPTFTLSDDVVGGEYRAVFGNRIRVHRDSIISSGEVSQTVVYMEEIVSDTVIGGGASAVRVISADTLVRPGADLFQLAGTPSNNEPNFNRNERQFLTVTGAGTFRLTFSGQVTADIATTATPAQVEAALEALTNLAPADVAVAGAVGGGSPWTVTFAGAFATGTVPTLVGSNLSTGVATDVVGLDRFLHTITTGDTVRFAQIFDSLPGFADPDGGGGPLLATPASLRPLGFAISREGTPIWVSFFPSNATATTPSGIFAQSDFPGFTLTADQRLAGAFNNTTNQPGFSEAHILGATSLARLGLQPADSILPRGLVNSFIAQWFEGSSTRANLPGGRDSTMTKGGGVYEASWASDPYGTVGGYVLNFSNPSATQLEIEAGLRSRTAAYTGLTDAATATLLGVPQEDLVAVRIPFTVRNTTFGRDVEIAMTRRVGLLGNTILLGQLADTIRIAVPPDEWIPGDRLIFIENITTDSTVTSGTGFHRVVLDASGQPIQVTRRQITFNPAVLACNAPNSCNPMPQGSRGATGYAAISDGDRTRWSYYAGFRPSSSYSFDLVGPVTGTNITQVTDSALNAIRVVPNPFIVFSQYQGTSAAESRIAFTGLPGRGTLRIYTVSGQFVQQITWEQADLVGDGDLFYNLRSREDIDIASGLYIWVVTAPSNPNDPNSTPVTARGKFVVIRGTPN